MLTHRLKSLLKSSYLSKFGLFESGNSKTKFLRVIPICKRCYCIQSSKNIKLAHKNTENWNQDIEKFISLVNSGDDLKEKYIPIVSKKISTKDDLVSQRYCFFCVFVINYIIFF